jgi:hypothetical protein
LPGQISRLEKWVAAYHGTQLEALRSILNPPSGGQPELLFPGDRLANGHRLGVREGHLAAGFKRFNQHSGKDEWFDPTDKVFLSPSMRYVELPCYCVEGGEVTDLGGGRQTSVQVALLASCDPATFGIGPQTVFPHDDAPRICPDFPNSCLEFYTNRRQTIVVVAVLVRLPADPAFAIPQGLTARDPPAVVPFAGLDFPRTTPILPPLPPLPLPPLPLPRPTSSPLPREPAAPPSTLLRPRPRLRSWHWSAALAVVAAVIAVGAAAAWPAATRFLGRFSGVALTKAAEAGVDAASATVVEAAVTEGAYTMAAEAKPATKAAHAVEVAADAPAPAVSKASKTAGIKVTGAVKVTEAKGAADDYAKYSRKVPGLTFVSKQ